MSIWANPLYRIESRGRGPQAAGDWRGWLLGRGALAVLLRILPPVCVAGCILSARASWSQSILQTVAQLTFWMLPLFLPAVAALVGSAVAAGRDCQEERIQEWIVSPLDRGALVGGKVWGWVLPLGQALAIGALAGALVWELSWRAGWGVPVLAPIEGVLLVLEAWAALYLTASLGVWAGTQTRRAWRALLTALLLGLPCLLLMIGGLYYTLDLARLGGHFMAVGGAWLVGSVFHGLAEHKLR